MLLYLIEIHVWAVVQKCEHKLEANVFSCTEIVGRCATHLGIRLRKHWRSAQVLSVPTDLPNFPPGLLDPLHDTQRHIQANSNLSG